MAPFVASFPTHRVSVISLGEPFDIELVSASDAVAAQLGDAQVDLGEGPGWQAFLSQLPVLIPDVLESPRERWPVFRQFVSDLELHAIYSFPLSVGAVKIGSVDLYSDTVSTLSVGDIKGATALVDVAANEIFDAGLQRLNDGDDLGSVGSRREILQATGMVIAQVGIGPADALALIRARAFATGRPVLDVATDIVARRISLVPTPPPPTAKGMTHDDFQ